MTKRRLADILLGPFRMAGEHEVGMRQEEDMLVSLVRLVAGRA